jgi:hypothetical protein
LLDEPRPGTPRRITDAQVEAVVRDTLEATPRDATHWSTRAMAARSGLSQTTIRRIWHAFALQPHRSETFKLSQDPSSSIRCATSSACTWRRPTRRWSSVSTRKPARPALIPTTSRHEIEQLPSIRSGPLHGAESRIASIAARTPCATLGRGTICWIGVIVPTYSSGDSGD